jgi:hypothetical protein
MKKFLAENPDKVKEAENTLDKREPTPACPRNDKFVKKTLSNQNYNERVSDGDLFVEDLSHYNSNPKKCLPHYEVYKNLRDLENGKRKGSVTWDGKSMN